MHCQSDTDARFGDKSKSGRLSKSNGDASTPPAQGVALVRYNAACRAIAAAARVDEVKNILDVWAAMREYARRAKNNELVADAVEIQLRATRKLGQIIQAQKDSVGLNRGAAGGGKKDGPRGLLINPRDLRPTLASQGIDKNLAHGARRLAEMSETAFEHKVAEVRATAGRVVPRAVREVEIEQEREARRVRTAQGGTVADLYELIASGYRAGAIAIDAPWPFEQRREAHVVTEHYETMTLDEIKALPIRQLAAEHCAVFAWVTWPKMPLWREVLEAWGVTYSSLAFDWIKLNPSGEGLHWGNGYGTRSNPEPCLLAKVGNPLRLDASVHSVIMPPDGEHSEVIIAPVGKHSAKPDEVYRRIERLYGGPYLDLFARKNRDGWMCWSNGLPPPANAEASLKAADSGSGRAAVSRPRKSDQRG